MGGSINRGFLYIWEKFSNNGMTPGKPRQGIKILLCVFFILYSARLCSQTLISEGTDFWIAFPPNLGTATIKLEISAAVVTSGNVSSAFPGVNQAFSVTPGVVTELTLPAGVELQSGIENKGIRITSNDPVTVYGVNTAPASSDAYMALPVNVLGTDYRVMTYKCTLNGDATCFSAVATQDNTTLIIFNHQTNITDTIYLNTGQTYHVNSTALNSDVTGSRIQSNFPVAVYGSVKCVNIPSGCSFCDHIVEEMFPYYSWGKNYVTISLAGRDGSGDVFRVLAGEDNTTVSLNGTTVATLNTGDYYENILTGLNSINTDKATLVAQFSKGQTCSGGGTGDPMMMLIPPEEQFLTSYTVCNISGFTSHWINVAAPGYAISSIYQDGVLIPDTAFHQIGATSFYGARRQVAEGTHNMNSVFPFGVFVYGWRNADAYGYPGGCSLSPVGLVHSVTLLPDTSYGQLNVTNICLTANVRDILNNPVPGVLVNFNVSGINPLTGNAYSDNSGNAQYCYTQTGASAGQDHVFAESFGYNSDTVVVFWSYTPPCSNPTGGGMIGSDQSGCGSYTPATLSNLSVPSGEVGTLEYKWQQSITGSSSGFTDIPSSNSASYSPGTINQTTWFRRLARVDCMPDWSGAAISNVVETTMVNPLPVSLIITASLNNICAGTMVTFSATPVNAGSNPVFQWKVNGSNQGTGNNSFTWPPANGDVISCVLTSSEPCTTGNPALSNAVTMTVNPVLPVTVSISASANNVCAGTTVTFTAFPVNGGTLPSYQWKMNGANMGVSSQTFSYIPLNGDLVSCILTSSEVCTTGNPASSNSINMIVIPNLPVSVSIAVSANPFCMGALVAFTATPMNGGSSPGFQWKVNGSNTGTGGAQFSYIPANGDQLSCVLNSSISCVTNNPATSNTIVMSSLPVPSVSFALCFDSITTLNAIPFQLKGGVPRGGTYSGPGVNPLSGIFDPQAAGTGIKTITYSYTNMYSCNALMTRNIIVQASPAFNCGNNLTDLRDGKVYPTIQIGTQCWMQKNLNYGTSLQGTTEQTDNCINEKYCYDDIAANCNLYGGLYQWDELMAYNSTPGAQGLCPPGWHVPIQTEWNALFTFYQNQALAGKPLQDSILNGFKAKESGNVYSNISWKFQGFATIYWTSNPFSTIKALSHGMNVLDFSVSDYYSNRSNAFAVRCLKN